MELLHPDSPRSVLQRCAQQALRSHGVELGTDPRDEIQVAIEHGLIGFTDTESTVHSDREAEV